MKRQQRARFLKFESWSLRARISAALIALILGTGGRYATAQKGISNLESMVQQSGMIFAGRVIGVETGKKERRMNLFMTTYTFAVLEPIFGVEEDTLRIKQYGGEADGKKFYPSGVPRFGVGETVVVMLYPTSRIGMTSAVGKDQGKFWVRRDSVTGQQTVSNKLKNKGLFRRFRHPGLIAQPEWIQNEPESLPYNGFLETIRNIVGELKKDKRKR